MAGVTEQEAQYCPRLTLAQVCDEFGEHASGMVRHYQDRQIDNLMAQDGVRNSTELTAEQKAIGLVFLKWLNEEPMVNKAVRHCERLVWMRRNPGSKMVLPLEEVKRIPFEEIHDFSSIKKVRSRMTASCPFHEDKTPSFVIYSINTAHCFSCGWSGDTVAFIQKLHNLDFVRAVKWLQGVKK